MIRYALPRTHVGKFTITDLIDSKVSGATETGRCPCCGHAVRLATSPYTAGDHYTHDMPNIACPYNNNALHTTEHSARDERGGAKSAIPATRGVTS